MSNVTFRLFKVAPTVTQCTNASSSTLTFSLFILNGMIQIYEKCSVTG